MYFRSAKLLASAKDQACTYCGDRNGTTVSCHSNRAAQGKGLGIKAPDYYVAWLCQHCHDLYDGRIGRLTREECDKLWMRAHMRTVEQWFAQDIIAVR
jgi:hypothetical protein